MCRWTLVTLANTGQFRKVRTHAAAVLQDLAVAVGPTDAMFSIDSAAIVGTAGAVSNNFPKARAAGHAIDDGSHPAKKARTIHSKPEQACYMAPYTAGQNRPEAGLASSEAYDKSMDDEMDNYFGKPLDQFIADVRARNLQGRTYSIVGPKRSLPERKFNSLRCLWNKTGPNNWWPGTTTIVPERYCPLTQPERHELRKLLA